MKPCPLDQPVPPLAGSQLPLAEASLHTLAQTAHFFAVFHVLLGIQE